MSFGTERFTLTKDQAKFIFDCCVKTRNLPDTFRNVWDDPLFTSAQRKTGSMLLDAVYKIYLLSDRILYSHDFEAAWKVCLGKPVGTEKTKTK